MISFIDRNLFWGDLVNKEEKNNVIIDDVLRVEQEYILYLEGYNIKEIAELTERNYIIVFYDLFVLLKFIDNNKAEQLENLDKKIIKSKKM